MALAEVWEVGSTAAATDLAEAKAEVWAASVLAESAAVHSAKAEVPRTGSWAVLALAAALVRERAEWRVLATVDSAMAAAP